MNIDRFKENHVQILDSIATLRGLARAGIVDNAERIAERIISMSAVIKVHLAAEDRAIYPAIEASADGRLAELGRRFQAEMVSIAADYTAFARQWNTAGRVRADPEGFRAQANVVLRALHERMQREDRDFYPAVERS
jgi:hypothetical protein